MSRPLTHEDLVQFRSDVCDIAEVMFAEHGAENVSMRQIAAGLGVSPMTPYRYFASRDEILAAVRIRGFERFARKLEQASSSATGTMLARAMAAGRAYIEFGLRNANTYQLMFGHRQSDDEGGGPLGQAVARARATLSVYGDSLIALGTPKDEARAMETFIWSALHGAVSLELAATLPQGSAYEVLGILGRTELR